MQELDPIRVARDEVARPGVRLADSQALGERPGDLIDRYELLRAIGEGSMGTVWMAEQRDPVVRKIALKILKFGMDTREVLTRFEAERRALVLMDHPSIARVLDGGATRTGRPYFVMELVQGVPITQYCDEAKLGLRERLELFARVCEALQHAHQKGILHRDVKPSNVMVTLHDGTPLPKVIDFGIAHAASAELAQRSLFTQYAPMIGMLEHLAPEQAALSALDIDTRADIYSLGVLLYELLTGTKPFGMQKVLAQGYQELLRTIREDEPAKPSTQVSSLGAKGTAIAAQRHVSVEKLQHRLRGDLDWIVMKAIEKDRTRRYETVNSFALDLQRYLRGEAVLAAPPSASYRLRRFLGRRKKTTAVVGSIALLLIAGAIGAGIGWYETHRTNVALGLTVDEKVEQLRLADAAKTRADLAAAKAILAAEREGRVRGEAQKNATRALAIAQRAETITEFVTAALRPGDAQNFGGDQEMTILAAMDSAVRELQAGRFESDPEIEAALKFTIATILQNNGRLQEAEQLLVQALEAVQQLHPGDHREVAIRLTSLGLLRRALGRTLEAEVDLNHSWEMLGRLYTEDQTPMVAALTSLGLVNQDLGRLEAAETLFVKAVDMVQRLFPGDHPMVAECLSQLALTRRTMGRDAAAEPLLFQALEMLQRLPRRTDHERLISECQVTLGAVLLRREAFFEAEPHLLAAYRAFEARQVKVPAAEDQLIPVVLEHLVKLYEGLGNATEAAFWRARHDELRQVRGR